MPIIDSKIVMSNLKFHSTEKYPIGILLISTFPPKVCGIASYTQDLKNTLDRMFGTHYKTFTCAIKNDSDDPIVDTDYVLNVEDAKSYDNLARNINENQEIDLVILQHEFGLFLGPNERLVSFLRNLKKEIITSFHTVLSSPNTSILTEVISISNLSKYIIVMTHKSLNILNKIYHIEETKIAVIAHGTHLVPIIDRKKLKLKYGLNNHLILSTFGLIGPGKSIETTLLALPAVIKNYPHIKFLIIGKTHPNIVKNEGEKYRNTLMDIIKDLHLENYVEFVNQYLPINSLIEYLQLTDIYLFTSKDPNQAVSGTFAYALSSGCPIISTPIPHAIEVVTSDIGRIINFESVSDLIIALKSLLKSESLREKIRSKALEKMSPTAWENSAIKHALLINNIHKIENLSFDIPEINLDHIKNMTTDFGILQFSKLSIPDKSSGYTLDDNARALIAVCNYYQKTGFKYLLAPIQKYLNFIKFCQQPNGQFLNYVNYKRVFTPQNQECNLEDANGRAIWALGTLISMKEILPSAISELAEDIIEKNIDTIKSIRSPRSMAFIIKGLYLQNSEKYTEIIVDFSSQLSELYQQNSSLEWLWFEDKITYANSILCEAMLIAWKVTQIEEYKKMATESLTFLLSKIYYKGQIHPISNQFWLDKNADTAVKKFHGEQPIEVCYTILTLIHFFELTRNYEYKKDLNQIFYWFLGNNYLNQIIYNPKTGGCYDGIEEKNVNLNQGAESTLCYLMARLNF